MHLPAILALLLLAGASSEDNAKVKTFSRDKLKGLKPISLECQVNGPFLPERDLCDQSELELRKARVALVEPKRARAWILVDVSSVETSAGQCFGDVGFALSAEVIIESTHRKTVADLVNFHLQTEVTNCSELLPAVKKILSHFLDMFLGDYLAANP